MNKNIEFVSPISNQKLSLQSNFLFSKTDGYVFPIIFGIPCLLKSNGILGTKLQKFLK